MACFQIELNKLMMCLLSVVSDYKYIAMYIS